MAIGDGSQHAREFICVSARFGDASINCKMKNCVGESGVCVCVLNEMLTLIFINVNNRVGWPKNTAQSSHS